jgi:acetyltransferase-like isoleucine patch superfamily enzyme
MSVPYRIWGLRRLVLVIQNLIFNVFYQTRLGNRVKIFGYPIVSLAKSSEVRVGTNLVLISHSYFSEPGVNHPVVIRTLNPNARLSIGSNVGISGGGICVARQVKIGDNVMMGANSFITDTDFHPTDSTRRRFRRDNVASKEVVIQDNVFIGMNALVLKGVTIGQNSVIGAGSIVTGDIPPNSIATGIPARVIKQL